MTTIKEVAKKAGVSISVVSKAFNNYADIKEETRQRIFAVANELNYSPNIVAKNLSSKKQMTFGLITSGVLNNNEKDNNAFDIFKGVYTAVSESQYELSIFLIDSQSQKQKSYVQYCRERNIGGAILQGIRTDDQYYKELINTNIPCVVLDIMTETENGLIGSVSIDNVKAGEEIAAYLLERNHRDIIVVAGTEETYVNSERLKGVHQAFEQREIKLVGDHIFYAEFSEQKAYSLAKEYLQDHRPTAFLCFSDLMAFGVIKAIQEKGLKIPEDISVTGFDDLVLSRYSQPSLTTIRQDFMEIGRLSAVLLQNLKEGKAEKQHIYMEHGLVERESVKTIFT
ncbi:transcriptional regulator [Planococcus antarcticus DSM 14505]|uniref:Transcriptional regulator n=1 Tax=Planococcus antarcticus DSM 14505 TaxID=1185653 RepID=A0A1C7DKA0_9BACL|nr:LacI family DNA-binding transcriptional regulator [Planococcus antarcticus]ANU11812.1 LacI family transcriptional regulator [Planococcus antarcticus DSM 14505]EIM06330.1 transcriptional regulator [Planococcus antarcticus DSM 14505]